MPLLIKDATLPGMLASYDTPLVQHLREQYSPRRIAEHDVALSVALHGVIVAANGAAKLCRELRGYEPYPWFAVATKELQQHYEKTSETQEVHTRVSGGIRLAMRAMCEASDFPVEVLAALPSTSFIGPLVYFNSHRGGDLAAGDLTVYQQHLCTDI